MNWLILFLKKYFTNRISNLLILYALSLVAIPCYPQLDKYDTRDVNIFCEDSTIKTSVLTRKVSVTAKSDRYYYWVNNDKLFANMGGYAHHLVHGPFKVFDRNGAMIAKGQFKQGLKQGQWNHWSSNGFLIEQCNWKNGKKDGTRILYSPEGAILAKEQYNEGYLDGICEYYREDELETIKYKNGIVQETIPFVERIKHLTRRDTKSSMEEQD